MYKDIVTLFVRENSENGDIWHPITIDNVDLNADRGAIIRQYGANSTDNAKLHIRYTHERTKIKINGHIYVDPKDYKALTNKAGYITLASGNDFGFFIDGDWGSSEAISDYDYPDGFYNYVNQHYDHCYAITSAARYSVIPHFEVLAR